MVMMKDEALVVSSFFCGKGGGVWGEDEVAPLKNFQKNFFGSGYGVVFEWVGGIGNSGFVVGTVLSHHTPLSKSFSFLQM